MDPKSLHNGGFPQAPLTTDVKKWLNCLSHYGLCSITDLGVQSAEHIII